MIKTWQKGAEPPAGVTIYRVPVKRMKNSELKEYLDTFPADAEVSVIIANPKERKRYPLKDYHGVTDLGKPVFLLEVGKPENLEEEKDADIPGQMEIGDIPGVMP